jgi:hypothetical protein
VYLLVTSLGPFQRLSKFIDHLLTLYISYLVDATSQNLRIHSTAWDNPTLTSGAIRESLATFPSATMQSVENPDCNTELLVDYCVA